MNNKQQKILNTAIKLFIQYGSKKTTMDEIAQTANVSKVTIYKYFGDKESLYLAVGKSIFEHYISVISHMVSENKPINQKLSDVMNALTDFVVSDKMSLCVELSKLNDTLQNEYIGFSDEYMRLITRLIDEGKTNGKIKNNIDSTMVFYYIDMGISYFQNNIEYRQKMLNDIEFQNKFMDFILSNIFMKEGENNH